MRTMITDRVGVEPTPLPPWGVILLHLGACSEAITWAAKRPVSSETLQACPSREWRVWLAKRLHVTTSAAWVKYETALRAALSGSGSGSGYGSGDGSGSGYGDGYGSGSGYGSGYGDGSGDGYDLVSA